jgi:hypothetical protein
MGIDQSGENDSVLELERRQIGAVGNLAIGTDGLDPAIRPHQQSSVLYGGSVDRQHPAGRQPAPVHLSGAGWG